VDQIFDRLERLVKSWVNSASDSASEYAGKNPGSTPDGAPSGDPDLDAAMAELDDYLDISKTETERREAAEKRASEERARREREKARAQAQRQNQSRFGNQGSQGYGSEGAGRPSVFEQKAAVDQAYHYLGLPPDAPMVDVKSAYKKLLMKYHPDRNTETPESVKKATEISARVNAAYQLIETWEESKKRNK
jgi:DnaJ-domain-containing protein 1